MPFIRQPDKSAYDNPLMVATFISTAVRDRNPFRKGFSFFWQGFKDLFSLRRNMALADQRIQILESRLAQVQAYMDSPAHQGIGERIDKLR